MSRYISMVTRYGSKRGGNYGSMGAVDFGTRGGRDAGRRHELRRYRKSLVGCSPCRAAPERLYSYIRALLLFIILIFAPVFNEREEERVREPCPLRHSSRVAYHTPVKASRTRPLSTGKAVHTARATAHTPRRATLARGSHPRGRAAAQARADAPTRSLQLALYRAYMCNYKHGIH